MSRHCRPAAPQSNFVDLLRHYSGFVRPHTRELLLPTVTIDLVIMLREDEVRQSCTDAELTRGGKGSRGKFLRSPASALR